MKLSRILIYGIAGIVAGLLLENQALIVRQRLLRKAIQKKKEALRDAEKSPNSKHTILVG